MNDIGPAAGELDGGDAALYGLLLGKHGVCPCMVERPHCSRGRVLLVEPPDDVKALGVHLHEAAVLFRLFQQSDHGIVIHTKIVEQENLEARCSVFVDCLFYLVNNIGPRTVTPG